jgi:hypothetical protein
MSFGRRREFPHLPPGRTPGAQTLRTRQRRDALSPLLGVVGAGMFAAGIWVAAGGRGSRFDRSEELWGGLLFAVFGLLALYVVFVVWGGEGRRLRGVALEPTAETLRRGDELSLVVTTRGDGVAPLEVGLVCIERADTELRTNVTVTRETAEATLVEEWQELPAGAREHTVTFRIPSEAPYSYEGDCVSYAWKLSARAVEPGTPDARLDRPIWVDA